jgi:tRNA (cytidine56-2'-O)-methyltransferase
VNREQAIALLDKHCAADESWRDHCLQVSSAARQLAETISHRGHPVDVERTEVLGLLHDLGRSQGHSLRHGIEGYLLLRRAGHRDEARICLAHVLKGRSLEDAVSVGLLTDDERLQLTEDGWRPNHMSLEEKIVTVVDTMISDTQLVPIEDRYASVRDRYGALPHHYEDESLAKGLSEEIAQLLGMDPYDALKGARGTES